MGARILLVEDNPTNLQLMEYLLRAFGHTTLAAADGEAGVAMASQEAPDVILMDLEMPKLNGYEAVKQIKAIPALRGTPVIAVTAIAMVGDRDRILGFGFDGYISKPISPDVFVKQVEQHIGRSGTAAPERPIPVPGQPGERHNIRVLIVDNSAINRRLVTSTLEPFGYEVHAASSVDEAIDLARRDPPSLILSDVHMPGQSGYDLLRSIRQDEALKPIPFVFISSTVWGESERTSGLQQGADGFILRPIEPDALLREVGRFVRIDRTGR